MRFIRKFFMSDEQFISYNNVGNFRKKYNYINTHDMWYYRDSYGILRIYKPIYASKIYPYVVSKHNEREYTIGTMMHFGTRIYTLKILLFPKLKRKYILNSKKFGSDARVRVSNEMSFFDIPKLVIAATDALSPLLVTSPVIDTPLVHFRNVLKALGPFAFMTIAWKLAGYITGEYKPYRRRVKPLLHLETAIERMLTLKNIEAEKPPILFVKTLKIIQVTRTRRVNTYVFIPHDVKTGKRLT